MLKKKITEPRNLFEGAPVFGGVFARGTRSGSHLSLRLVIGRGSVDDGWRRCFVCRDELQPRNARVDTRHGHTLIISLHMYL